MVHGRGADAADVARMQYQQQQQPVLTQPVDASQFVGRAQVDPQQVWPYGCKVLLAASYDFTVLEDVSCSVLLLWPVTCL